MIKSGGLSSRVETTLSSTVVRTNKTRGKIRRRTCSYTSPIAPFYTEPPARPRYLHICHPHGRHLPVPTDHRRRRRRRRGWGERTSLATTTPPRSTRPATGRSTAATWARWSTGERASERAGGRAPRLASPFVFLPSSISLPPDGT